MATRNDVGGAFTWEPTSQTKKTPTSRSFMREVGVATLDELWALAHSDIASFYDRLVLHLQLSWLTPYRQVLDLSRGVPFARWFVGGNTTRRINCIDRHIEEGRAQRPAIISESENGATRTLTFEQLLVQVSKLCGALSDLGVHQGDTVGIFMPLIPETAIALLAIGRMGAIAVPAFSGYGAQALATRLDDAKAKVLLTVDGALRRGRFVNMKSIADAACDMVPSIKHAIVLRHNDSPTDWHEASRC